MDDSQKTQQNSTNVADQSQVQVPSVPLPQPEPVNYPISSPSRESGPASPISSESLASLSTPEMIISPELHKETGAEAVSEAPTLTPEDAQAGIVHAKESTPVSVIPQETIVLPMTQPQAQQTVKIHKKVKDSLFWFAMLILRQWQVAQKKGK